MHTDIMNSENAKIASDFLGWKPPLPIELAVKICDGMTFSEGHFRDLELEKMTKFWVAGEARRTLPNFRIEVKAMFRLLKQFRDRALFVEIVGVVGVGADYVVTVFSDFKREKIVSTGRSNFKTEAVYFATLDFLKSKHFLSSKKSAS